MNTIFHYFYRDGSNYKIHSSVVLKGTFSEKEIEEIISFLDNGCYFIPEQVNLPATRFEEWDIQDDDDFFEYSHFEETAAEAPNDTLTAQQLLENFRQTKGVWKPVERDWGEMTYTKSSEESSTEFQARVHEFLGRQMLLGHDGPTLRRLMETMYNMARLAQFLIDIGEICEPEDSRDFFTFLLDNTKVFEAKFTEKSKAAEESGNSGPDYLKDVETFTRNVLSEECPKPHGPAPILDKIYRNEGRRTVVCHMLGYTEPIQNLTDTNEAMAQAGSEAFAASMERALHTARDAAVDAAVQKNQLAAMPPVVQFVREANGNIQQAAISALLWLLDTTFQLSLYHQEGYGEDAVGIDAEMWTDNNVAMHLFLDFREIYKNRGPNALEAYDLLDKFRSVVDTFDVKEEVGIRFEDETFAKAFSYSEAEADFTAYQTNLQGLVDLAEDILNRFEVEVNLAPGTNGVSLEAAYATVAL